MTITWHGLYTIKLVTPQTTLIIDPHPKTDRFPAVRSKASIVALSNPAAPDMSHLEGIQEDPLIINTPGEYSADDLTLSAISWRGADGNERSLHRWHIENMVIVHLGSLDRALTPAELQKLEQTDTDILLLPIGGSNSPMLKIALSILTTIEPRIVIPINYDSVNAFAKQMGVSTGSTQPRLNISRRKLPEEGLETIILSA
jgi:L-ascorbate metabolism protein UlaG (beta-lactamase superfamily)